MSGKPGDLISGRVVLRGLVVVDLSPLASLPLPPSLLPRDPNANASVSNPLGETKERCWRKIMTRFLGLLTCCLGEGGGVF